MILQKNLQHDIKSFLNLIFNHAYSFEIGRELHK